jgi:hypothetical protein
LLQKALLNSGHSRARQRRPSGARWGRGKENAVSLVLRKLLIYVFLLNNTALYCWDTLGTKASAFRDQIGGVTKERGKESKCLSNYEIGGTVQVGRNQNNSKHARSSNPEYGLS